jgi:hypothetical protein
MVEGGRKHNRHAEVIDLIREHVQTQRKEKINKNKKRRGRVGVGTGE